MNRDVVLTVALALCCVFAIGTSATSLESAVSTKPSEVVEVDYASLPIDSADAERLRRQVEGAANGQLSGKPTNSNADSATAASAGGGEQDAQKRAGEAKDGNPKAQQSKDSGESQQSKQKQKRKQKKQTKQGQKSGSQPPEESLVERLLDLLAALFDLLLRALPLLALAAVLIRYRRRIAARLAALVGRDRAEPNDGRAPPIDPDPGNEVASAWYEMVAGLGLDRDPARTPRECARRAVDAGLDREAVGGLTEAFEAVRYGDHPPTSELSTRARQSIRRLREQGFGGDDA